MNNGRRKSRAAVRLEQRRNRSEVPQEAACLYLEAAAERCEARALALASEDGLLVASTRGGYDMHGIAAVGAACANGHAEGPLLDRMMDKLAPGEDLYASGVTIGDKVFYLTSVGARVRSVKSAAADLARILGPVLPTPT